MLLPSTIEGRLTADPELRFTASGAAVCSFTVVCSDRRKNETTDEWEDKDTTFWRCSVWRRLAENVAESLQKGDNVIVVGKIKQRNFESKGESRTTFEVDVQQVGVSLQFRTVRHGEGKAERGSSTAAAASAPASDPWASDPAPPY